MPRYYVVAKEEHLYFAQIEAEDQEKAALAASELTERDFEYLDIGNWEIVDIQKIHEELKQAKLF
jgi:hypothetical protein